MRYLGLIWGIYIPLPPYTPKSLDDIVNVSLRETSSELTLASELQDGFLHGSVEVGHTGCFVVAEQFGQGSRLDSQVFHAGAGKSQIKPEMAQPSCPCYGGTALAAQKGQCHMLRTFAHAISHAY